MSLYGALFTGVSGLKAQSSKIGVISDNIANVNTIGYKQATTQFETLVVNNNLAATGAYSPGGVLANTRQEIDKQGLLQATAAPTDIAMSGDGFFVVNAKADGTDVPQYTRAGSFRADSVGNFVNAAGFFLQGWRLDADGNIPFDNANLDSLETVFLDTATGDASATSRISMGINLDATQTILPGEGDEVTMDINSAANYNISADDIIVSNQNGLAPTNSIVQGDEFDITTGNGLQYTYEYGGFVEGNEVSGATPILDATTVNETFISASSPTVYSDASKTFTINTATSGTVTFTYTNNSPNLVAGEFNNLSNLAATINEVVGLTARVQGNRLVVGAENANEAVTFDNGDDVGVPGPPALSGIDWEAELGIANIAAGNNRFSTLQGLADMINEDDGITAVVNNPLSNTSLDIRVDDPMDTIRFDDGATNTGSLLAELGLVDSLVGGPFAAQTTGILGPRYDPNGGVGENMASGDIEPQFSRSLRVFDSLGAPHDLQMSFIKLDENIWASEIYALPESDVNSNLVDGQIATGTIVFNGDGSLRSVSPGLSNPVEITWTNGSVPSVIELDLGTAGLPRGTENAANIGDTDGFSQFASDYNVRFVNQNGSQVGDLVAVNIDEEGIVSVSFNNGDVQSVYKLPVADFANPNGLAADSGNVFSQTRGSGEVNLREAGDNGTGNIVSGALEASNVELSDQLTDLIVAQRAYQSNTRAITTSDELLEELNRL